MVGKSVVVVEGVGEDIQAELAERMLELPGLVVRDTIPAMETDKKELDALLTHHRSETRKRDKNYLKEESAKLDAWAADMRRSAKSRMTRLDNEVRELRSTIRLADDIEDQLKTRQNLRRLEKRRDEQEYEYRKQIREIEEKTDALLDIVESSLQATESLERFLSIKWRLR